MSSHSIFGVSYYVTRKILIKEKGTGSTCEKAIIEWIKLFRFNVRLQLADKVTALDGFQATVDTAGHREAAESIHSLVLLSASSPYVGCVLRFTFISDNL